MAVEGCDKCEDPTPTCEDRELDVSGPASIVAIKDGDGIHWAKLYVRPDGVVVARPLVGGAK